jgi:hypothetical protein
VAKKVYTESITDCCSWPPAKLRCSRERSARHQPISGPERYARGHSAPELHIPEAWLAVLQQAGAKFRSGGGFAEMRRQKRAVQAAATVASRV